MAWETDSDTIKHSKISATLEQVCQTNHKIWIGKGLYVLKNGKFVKLG